jgi:uncharacterized membrane-anchored protein YitT (DUF2179 family)
MEKAKQLIFLILGILSASLGIKGFLLPNHFIDGGITGISMLLSKIFNIKLSFLIVLINSPFLYLGHKSIGKKFALISAISILTLSICLLFVEFPIVTHDKLLASVFGGFFLGAGIGLSIRANSVLDGTEILALILSRKTPATVGDLILILNLIIFSVSIFALGLESALYSILTYFSASKTINFILHGIEEFTGIVIISNKFAEIREAIFEQTERGVTVYKGEGGFSSEDKNILFCVITRLEIPKIKSIIEEIDNRAFYFTHSISEVQGGMIKATSLSKLK